MKRLKNLRKILDSEWFPLIGIYNLCKKDELLENSKDKYLLGNTIYHIVTISGLLTYFMIKR